MNITQSDYNWAVQVHEYNEDYINDLYARFDNYDEETQLTFVAFINDLQEINNDLHKIINVYELQSFEKARQSIYIVNDGDTLPIIAQKVYKDYTLWELIFHANNLNDMMLETGLELSIPTEEAVLI